MKRYWILATCVMLGMVFMTAFSFQEARAEWPEKPINLIVPWGAGGSTDRSSRTTAGIIEEHLGQKIVVVNQPGASGSVGTKGIPGQQALPRILETTRFKVS
jgi:tripartite-type tricarboxylate transporter receptor subunit TctC